MDADTSGAANDRLPPPAPSARSSPEWQTRLLATLDALPDILFVLDRRGCVLDYHAPNRFSLYMPPERFLGQNAIDLLPEPTATVVRQAIAEALATGHHQGGTYALNLPQGERWFELSIAVHGDLESDDARLVVIARDVTERKRAEDALRDSEEKYRLLTERMKDVVWILDVEAQRFTYVSPSVEQLRGYTAAEILAQPLEEAWAPEEDARMANLTQQAIADFRAGKIDEDTYFPFELRQPRKDGSVLSAEAVCHFVRNRRTGRLEVHGVTRDVTKRARTERALRESEERFAQTARQSRTFVWEIDADGLYMFVTPVVEDVLGYRPDEIAGRLHFYDLHPAESREEYKATVLAAARQGQEFRNLENPMVAKDGRTIWVSTNAFPLRGADGSLLGYRGSDMDITARKLAEESLRESEARTRAVQDNLPDGLVYQIDSGPDGQERRFSYVSQGVERLHGVTAEEVLRNPMAIYGQVLPEDLRDVAAREAHAAQTQTPLQAEVRVRLPSGEIRWRRFTSAPRRLANGHLVWDGIEIDVTDRKLAEEALRESEGRFTASTKASRSYVWQVDPTGLITYVSPMVEEVLGRRPEEIVGQLHFYDLLPPEDREEIKSFGSALMARRETIRGFENRNVAKDGRRVWLSSSASPLFGPDGTFRGYQGIDTDITARKQAEEALRESEARFAAATRASRSFVWQVDPDGLYTYVGDMVAEVLGYRPEDLVGRMHFYDLAPPEGRAELKQACFEIMARREAPSGFENANVAKDGRLVWLSSSAHPLFDADGTYRGYQGIDTDIAERKQAEEALRASEARYRQLYEAMRDPFARIDLKGRIEEINPAFEELLGYSSAELVGKSFRTITPRKWHAAEKKIVAEQVRKRGFSAVYETEYVRKDGTVVPVELRTMLVRDAAGKPTGMSAVVRDISERKRAEEGLRRAHDELERRVRERTAELETSRQTLAESEEQFRQMAEGIQEVFWLLDVRSGQALYVSPAFEAIWGRPRQTLRNGLVQWLATLHPDDRDTVQRDFDRGVRTGTFTPLEYRILWPDGTVRWIRDSAWGIRDPRGRVVRVAGVFRDITDQRRLEAEILQAAEAERQRLGRDLHDSLGQSLTAIGYLADAVREDLDRANRPEAADIRKLGRLIGQTAAEAHALARDLLLADMKRGGLAAALQELALRTQEVFGIACRYSGPGPLPPLDVHAAGQIYRIAQEAVANAAKHAHAKRIEVRLAKERRGLLLTVRDTGRGLPSRRQAGPGLGLDIMRYRAGLIGATLWIESQPRCGTTVNCLLPRAAPARKRKR